MPTKEECWEELTGALSGENLFSSYNLLEKRRRVTVFFFQHPVSPGCEEPESVSICINKRNIGGVWEIFLNKNGTWTLL